MPFECPARFNSDGIVVTADADRLAGLVEALWDLLSDDDELIGTAASAVLLPDRGVVSFDYPSEGLEPESIEMHRRAVAREASALSVQTGSVTDWVRPQSQNAASLTFPSRSWDILPWETPLGDPGERLPPVWADTLVAHLSRWGHGVALVEIGNVQVGESTLTDWGPASHFNFGHGRHFEWSDPDGKWATTGGNKVHRIRLDVPEGDWDIEWEHRFHDLTCALSPSPALMIESTSTGPADDLHRWFMANGPLQPVDLSAIPATVTRLVTRTGASVDGTRLGLAEPWCDGLVCHRQPPASGEASP